MDIFWYDKKGGYITWDPLDQKRGFRGCMGRNKHSADRNRENLTIIKLKIRKCGKLIFLFAGVQNIEFFLVDL